MGLSGAYNDVIHTGKVRPQCSLSKFDDRSQYTRMDRCRTLWQLEEHYGHFLTVSHGTFWAPNTNGLA
ncbi:hypothetical protein ARMSODRAFT_967544 [Armillaria solidipes]|uniref:Uncharacterized protein n=1 Tax=Armillaria solidipes TaxID=1076256 RepID=A0A2H3APE8_9AGAR|nr:hypothetical protein ARMSODRAFT_967544 [Armillaria solidipes]